MAGYEPLTHLYSPKFARAKDSKNRSVTEKVNLVPVDVCTTSFRIPPVATTDKNKS